MTSGFLSLLIAVVKGTGSFGAIATEAKCHILKIPARRGGAGKLWEEFMKKSVLAFGALALGVAFSAPAMAAEVSACLITKTDTNPFFVKMKKVRRPRPRNSAFR